MGLVCLANSCEQEKGKEKIGFVLYAGRATAAAKRTLLCFSWQAKQKPARTISIIIMIIVAVGVLLQKRPNHNNDNNYDEFLIVAQLASCLVKWPPSKTRLVRTKLDWSINIVAFSKETAYKRSWPLQGHTKKFVRSKRLHAQTKVAR